MEQSPSYTDWLKRQQAVDYPRGGAIIANPGLAPQGMIVFEDGSYGPPPPPTPGAVRLLPGLFGHGPNAKFTPEG